MNRNQEHVSTNNPRDPASLDLHLRYEVTPADRDAVRELCASTGFFYPKETDVAVELVDERLAKGAASGYHFVLAERDGRMVGYTNYGLIACTQSSYDLYWIVVHESCRGQGLGRLLLAETERLIQQAGGTRVYIETSNRPLYQPTRVFYERCGYREDAILKDFYAPQDDKVIFVHALP